MEDGGYLNPLPYQSQFLGSRAYNGLFYCLEIFDQGSRWLPTFDGSQALFQRIEIQYICVLPSMIRAPENEKVLKGPKKCVYAM